MKIFLGAVVGFILLFVLIGAIAVIDSSNDSDITNPYETVSGFESISHVNENLYSYRKTNSEESYSITLAKNQGPSDDRRTTYPLGYGRMTIQPTTVYFSFNDDLKVDEQIIQPAYSSLYFDFSLNGIDHAGQITSLSDTSSKEPLLEILKEFVAQIVNS